MDNSRSFMNDVQEVGMILERAKEMNKLFKESERVESEVSKIRNKREEILKEVENYVQEEEQETIMNMCEIFKYVLNNETEKLEKKNEVFLDKYRKAATIRCNLETRMDKLMKNVGIYRGLKLKATEANLAHPKEIIALLLIINFKNRDITEDDFFEDPEEFFDKVRTSVYEEIIYRLDDAGMFKNNRITDNMTIYTLLDLV